MTGKHPIFLVHFAGVENSAGPSGLRLTLVSSSPATLRSRLLTNGPSSLGAHPFSIWFRLSLLSIVV
jgi:hypothetical protein